MGKFGEPRKSTSNIEKKSIFLKKSFFSNFAFLKALSRFLSEMSLMTLVLEFRGPSESAIKTQEKVNKSEVFLWKREFGETGTRIDSITRPLLLVEGWKHFFRIYRLGSFFGRRACSNKCCLRFAWLFECESLLKNEIMELHFNWSISGWIWFIRFFGDI